MDAIVSTKELKAKIDDEEGVTVVETVASERYREAHIPGALNIPPERIKQLDLQLFAEQGCRDLHLLHEQSLTRQRLGCP